MDKIMGYYAISVSVTRKSNGWTSTRQIPTFYLDENVQGITDENLAHEIALDIVDPLETRKPDNGNVIFDVSIFSPEKNEVVNSYSTLYPTTPKLPDWERELLGDQFLINAAKNSSEVIEKLRNEEKIGAIKELKTLEPGWNLKEYKEAIESPEVFKHYGRKLQEWCGVCKSYNCTG